MKRKKEKKPRQSVTGVKETSKRQAKCNDEKARPINQWRILMKKKTTREKPARCSQRGECEKDIVSKSTANDGEIN